jgi:uncharacterized protein (TIGR02271 family)
MESRRAQIEPGAAVEATDGLLGTVDEVIVRPGNGELAYLTVRHGWTDQVLTVPAALIAAIPGPRVVLLRATREEARAAVADVLPDELLASERGDGLHLPIAEERLVPAKQLVDLGELRLHKSVTRHEEVIREPVTRDDLVVERVPIGRPLDAPLEPRFEGDWLIIPIMEEVLVVRKQLMLTEEVRLRKRQVTEEREVHETTRHERIELEDATVYGVNGLRSGTETTRLTTERSEPVTGGAATPPGAIPAAQRETVRLVPPEEEH